MKENSREKKAFLLLILAMSACALLLLMTFSIVPVNPDAGDYIPIAREVFNGATPTVEVKTVYPPGLYYTYAAWMRLAGTDFPSVLLLNYLTHAGNAFLIFFAVLRQTRSAPLAAVFALVALFSVFVAEGYAVGIEPFLVFFSLLAYHVYLSSSRPLWKFGLMGALLGCALMMKQYAFLTLAGFTLIVAWDARKAAKGITAPMLLVVLCAFLPFLAFLTLTDASLDPSLRAFGILGDSALSYAAMQPDAAAVATEILREFLHFNWLILPVLYFWYLARTWREIHPSGASLGVLFLVSLGPLVVRRFGHYYQLIVPWSCMLWALIVHDALGRLRQKERDLTGLLLGAFLCIVTVIPLFMVLTPPFSRHRPLGDIVLVAAAFLVLTFLILAGGLYATRRPVCRESVVILLTASLVIESLFFCSKLPFRHLADEAERQTTEAREINKVLPPGTAVHILGAPHLYVTCGLLNPLRDYTFVVPFAPGDPRIASTDWGTVNTILQKREAEVIPGEVLKHLGYARTNDLSGLGYDLYRRDGSLPKRAFAADRS